MLRSTVTRPVCLGVKPHLEPKNRFLLLSDSCWFVDVGRPLPRKDRSVLYNCCWSSPAQSFSGPSPTGLDHILLSQIRDSPNLEGQVPVFISPRNRMARLYPQVLGSLFVASYDSQGYSGDIRNRLHAGCRSDDDGVHTLRQESLTYIRCHTGAYTRVSDSESQWQEQCSRPRRCVTDMTFKRYFYFQVHILQLGHY
jgi:hypothetical protein